MRLPQRTGFPVSVLMFTPMPTHPAIQGNRQRAFDICRAIQSMGADITLLHYATEQLGANEIRQIREAWQDLEVVFPRNFVPQHSLVRYPAIDDWFDKSIGDAAMRLSSQKNFDVCIVNYVWYSKVFESLPSHVIRVIDTHDIFGGRAQRFTEVDLIPQWFHTSEEEESKGLDRADFVLAIQAVEALALQARTKAHVRTVGFLSAPDYLPPPRPASRHRLKVGYVGSANPFNVSSILSLARTLQIFATANLGFEVHVAGPICAAISGAPHPFVIHGIVESVSDFYRSIDMAVNPMLGGTGLKIKSLEALSFGKPLVATRDAMTGIDTSHDGHQLADMEQVVRRLQELSEAPARLGEEAEISRRVFDSYRRTQLREFSSFWSLLEQGVRARRLAPLGSGAQ